MRVLLLLFPTLLLLRQVWLRLRPQPFSDPSTTAAPAASSSSSTSAPNGGGSKRYPYRVFLSFRGEDTRHNFVSHLYKELTQKGVHTFKDDHDLKRGDSLTPSLLEAISGSMVAVVVLSEHYASSTWCLNELVEIIECRKKKGQLVIPIFYEVDPSDVKNQRGSFGKDLEKHGKIRKRENNYGAEMEKWRNALSQVATVAGWDSRNMRDEANLIECVVRDISDKLICATSSDICEEFVAIGSQIAEIDKLLEVKRDVHMLGIWGMGGIGKTTLAYVFYKRMSPQYQDCCFLRNVKDKLKKNGVIGLQKELLSKVLKENNLNTWSLDEDSSMIKERLHCKKVLIVLDDVDDIEQLEVLAKRHNWFGLGSIIIITTRDKRLLHQQEVDVVYEMKYLKNDEALQLFNLHAFKPNQIKEDYLGLPIDFVEYAKGLPLALKVLGCFLRGRDIDFWKDEQQKLRSTSDPSISDVLKVSFDGLQENEKDVFLNIACFHNWSDKGEVIRILRSCGLFANMAFSILIEKSLISIQNNKVYMHELLQDMGCDIVRRESVDKPGERSRLWDPNDVNYVLTNKKGTEMIKNMSLKTNQIQGKMNLEVDAFVGMNRLRFLQVKNTGWWELEDKVHIQDEMHRGLQFYSNELAYLCWQGYPLKSLSLGVCAQSLIELDLSDSKVEILWERPLDFVNLKVLNLRGSKLVRTPDLSKAQNIEEINLGNCESLIEVHSSIKFLGKLEVWDMSGCKNLCPLPNFLGNFKSLKKLNLSEIDILKLPNSLGNLISLKDLDLENSAITELPQSIENLTLLEELCLRNCKKLESLPTNLYRLSSLLAIDVHSCHHLRSIPKLPPLLTYLQASNCESLENFSKNSIANGRQGQCDHYVVFDFWRSWKLSAEAYNNIFSFALPTFQKYSDEEVQFSVPGSEIPTWISNQAVGSSINIQTPPNFTTIRSVLCCVVFNWEHPPYLKHEWVLIYQCQFKGDSRDEGLITQGGKSISIAQSNQTMLFNIKIPKALDCAVGDELSFEFFVAREMDFSEGKVHKCGICIVG